ncbi:MAG: DUF1501 domain-containing protein [Pirellulales bacterium]|nr:DUF1501 domain-containing protein [Pirellulales bacterium]
MKPENKIVHRLQRRSFLHQGAYGLGLAALNCLLNPALLRTARGADPATESIPMTDHAASMPAPAPAGRWMGVITEPHFPIRAKRIIHLYMAGGPSHVDTLDHKPVLNKLDGQPFPESFTAGQQLAQLQNTKLVARGSFAPFSPAGQSGQMIAEIFPEIRKIADDICILRGMRTEQINHDTAHAFMNSGSIIKGRPSMGSWLLYGLGAETDNLPGFVVLTSQGRSGQQPISARQWSAGFLPSKFQGISFQAKGEPVHYLGNPAGICQSTQRQVVEEVQRLNGLLAAETLDPEVETRIAQYELAFKMQASVPELTDMTQEPKHILDLYGVKQPGDGTFASNVLLARRMAERGVRMIQVYHRAWDAHGNIKGNHTDAAQDVDRATAALILDLKQRGMLEDTLILWGGEFGRTPMAQGDGRDHHILAFSVFLAGGGIKPGVSFGETDELGYRSVQPIHVRDLHATLLRQMGIDHRKLSFKFQGLDAKLTGVEPARVIEEIV